MPGCSAPLNNYTKNNYTKPGVQFSRERFAGANFINPLLYQKNREKENKGLFLRI